MIRSRVRLGLRSFKLCLLGILIASILIIRLKNCFRNLDRLTKLDLFKIIEILHFSKLLYAIKTNIKYKISSKVLNNQIRSHFRLLILSLLISIKWIIFLIVIGKIDKNIDKRKKGQDQGHVKDKEKIGIKNMTDIKDEIKI